MEQYLFGLIFKQKPGLTHVKPTQKEKEPMLSKEAIEQLQNGIQKPEVVMAGAYEFLLTPNNMLAKKMSPAQPTHLTVNTLDGVVSYLKSSDPKNELWKGGEKYLVHIEGHDKVTVVSDLHPVHMLRRCYLSSRSMGNSFLFGAFLVTEEFIIGVMSNFVESECRENLLSFISQMKAQNSREEVDEGVSQNVTVRKSIATVANAQVPNPVYLEPYVTFPEIKQPERAYVFRIRQEKPEDPIKCGLFPIDSTVWISQTVDRIRDYLQGAIDNNDIPAVIIS
jgi:hypothetical protein